MRRCSQRGRRESGLRALLPPPCGQLTRCFSAVAELLVIIIIAAYQYLKVNYYILIRPLY